MSKNKSKSQTASAIATAAGKQGMVALRALLQRRQLIVCAVGIVVAGLLLWLLLPLIPRTAKPTQYTVGELSLASFTQVVGYRKVVATTESRSGLGELLSASYTYQAGKEQSQKDVEEYTAALQQDYGAVVVGAATPEPDYMGAVSLTLPMSDGTSELTMLLQNGEDSTKISLESRKKPLPRPEINKEVNVTPEAAEKLLMTLTKKETGFTADISVYTTTLEPDRAVVDDWEYYVFTVVADYSATRIEYRGTFYVGSYDGVVLHYDKETGATSRLRGSGGKVEEAAEPAAAEAGAEAE